MSATTEETPLATRIELRRFVGRELLLWLWFESEIFEGTLWTKEHGSFGMWLEGRLVLADLLHWASEMKPDHIVDLATLTGAALIAMGDWVNAIMGTDQKLVERLLDAGNATGEHIWQLPLVEEYRDSLRSPLADLKNITGIRWGGTIAAGLFLSEFVDHPSWAHVDLSGCWSSKERDYRPYGPSGEGPRFLLDWIMS